jgi:protocatechuate 3,4-dioxygenase beta subunit
MAASAASTASAVPAPASPASSAPASPAASAASGASAAAAACNGAVTPAETEGPFYKAGAPMKASLVEPGMTGTRLQLNGYVFNKSCQPVPQAKLDFWQADDSGRYDNQGYRLRGYVLADQAGRFEIETIIPGLYTGRTRHIHVKVTPPGGQTLTTQLYFPGEARNSSDGIFNQRLLVNIQDAPNGAKQATYSFVLNSA